MACRVEEGGARWYEDAEILAHEYSEHGSLIKAADAHGLHPTTLSKAWRTHVSLGNLPPLRRGAKPPPIVPERTGSWVVDALKKLGDDASVEALADHCDVSPKRVREELERLGHDGYRVDLPTEKHVVLDRVPTPSDDDDTHRILFDGEWYRFGVVSDTHMGSKHERLDELHYAYRFFADEGIDTVYHVGDLVCGYGIFPNQPSTVNLHTYNDQVDYAAAHYPSQEGITTHIIGGNHDLEGVFGRIGADPVRAVCNRRPDLVYGGRYRRVYELPQGTRIYMLHPQGGSSYAMSYKPQKIAEGFESGSKPNVCLLGHYHKRGDFEWRSIKMLLAGCFEGGGSFGARLALPDPAVGFHIVEMRVGDDGTVVRWRPEWFPFYPGRHVQVEMSKAA